METICYDAIDWWLQTVTNTIIKKFKIQDLKRQQSKLVDLQLHSGSVTANKTKAECSLQPVAKVLRHLEQKVCLMVTKKFVAKVAPITQSNVVYQCLMNDIAWLEKLQWGGRGGEILNLGMSLLVTGSLNSFHLNIL